MIRLKEGQQVMCSESLPDKGIRKGDIGIVETVTKSHYYISFNTFPLTIWSQDEVDRYLFIRPLKWKPYSFEDN